MAAVGPFRLELLGLLLDLLLRLPDRQRPGIALADAAQRVIAPRVHVQLGDVAVLLLGQGDRRRHGALVEDAIELAQGLVDQAPERRRDVEMAAGDIYAHGRANTA